MPGDIKKVVLDNLGVVVLHCRTHIGGVSFLRNEVGSLLDGLRKDAGRLTSKEK